MVYPQSFLAVLLAASAACVFLLLAKPAELSTSPVEVTPLSMAPLFSTSLHADDDSEASRALKAVSPPMFTRSFESTEETLPFELSIVSKSNQQTSEVTVRPVTEAVGAEGLESPMEEVREELVELELEAELKWAKR